MYVMICIVVSPLLDIYRSLSQCCSLCRIAENSVPAEHLACIV